MAVIRKRIVIKPLHNKSQWEYLIYSKVFDNFKKHQLNQRQKIQPSYNFIGQYRNVLYFLTMGSDTSLWAENDKIKLSSTTCTGGRLATMEITRWGCGVSLRPQCRWERGQKKTRPDLNCERPPVSMTQFYIEMKNGHAESSGGLR